MPLVSPRPPQVIAGRHTSDDGLFGPDSVTWQLHSEPVMSLVGVLAATTQMLHPRVMRMIDQASSFRDQPGERGRQTGLYMLTITFGDTATAQRAGAILRRVHQSVRATDPATGREYNAEEPDLLLWVQNSLTYCALRTFERYAPDTLTPAARERYIQEQRIAGELLGIDPATMPSSSAELMTYLDDVLPQLATIPESLWFRDMMTSRRQDGDRTPMGAEAVVTRLVMDEALSMMHPVHRELFGIHIPPWRRFAGRVATPLLFKAAASKVPTGSAVSHLREQIDIEAFGAPRAGTTAPTGGH